MSEAITVSTLDLSGLAWRKSSRSTVNGDNGNCVEIAFAGSVVAVRDSKSPVATLVFPVAALSTFLREA